MAKFKLDISQGIILCRARLSHRRNSVFVKLAVDTGASFTLISAEAALAIGIDPSNSTKHIEITTVSGTVFVPLVTIPFFECLGAQIKDLKTICHNLPPESPVEGLLGLDFLKAAKVILNFAQNVIEMK